MASAPPRTSLQLLRDRDFGILFWGKMGSLMAVWGFTVVILLLAYEATGSAGWTAVVGAALLAPQLLLALVSGRLSDIYGSLVLIVVGGLLQGLSAIGLGLWWQALTPATGASAVTPLVIGTAVFGCGLALSAPAMHSLVPRLVAPEELSAAVGLNFLPTALARTLGPAAGAVLTAAYGPVPSLVVVGSVLLAASLWFVLIRSPGPAAAGIDSDSRVIAAVRYVGKDRLLLASLAGVAAIGAGAEPAITLAPALAESVGQAAEQGGWAVSAFGCGGVLGVVAHQRLSRWFRPVTEGCVALLVLGVAMAVAGSAGSLIALMIPLAVAGVSLVVGITAFSVAVQQRCEAGMLGRVMGLWMIAFNGSRPLAGLVQGLLSDHWSTAATLWATATFAVVAACAVLFVSAREPRARRARGLRGRAVVSDNS